MFLKRKSVIFYIVFFIIYLILIIYAFYNIDNYSAVNVEYNSLPVIVIDAGHGGEDGGAVANNVVEKNINLSISNKLRDIFISSGFNVKMTRSSDKMINDSGDTLRERKVSDMKNRLKLFNESENNIVISIHQNKFTQEEYKGSQVFYGTNNKESEKLALSIKTSIKTLIQPDNEREIKPADRNIYLMYNSKTPSVIVECGFISNIEEARLLKDSAYQNKIAFAIYSGFLDYYNKRG
ncbi:MAG: N-acetylmuramoyl-L-alanine amidase [Ruminococcus sp.]|nr:N-acetylmuramoyl-L-alanine amidase [Ruminococcus sp.]